jgi:FkbM family methyltransferase
LLEAAGTAFPLLNRSWTYRLLRKHWGLLDLTSVLSYRRYLIGSEGGESGEHDLICLGFRSPIRSRVWLRGRSSDFYTVDELLVTGVYKDVLQRVESARYIVDLGANIGIASLLFASRYPDSEVFAVEADPDNFAILKRNLAALESRGRARAINRAVWSLDVALAVAPPPGTKSFSRIAVNADIAGASRTVAGVTMGEILEQCGFPRVDILKIDIEGAETELFKGEHDWLDRVGVIAIEFHGQSRRESGFDRILAEKGFAIDDSNPHTIIGFRP